MAEEEIFRAVFAGVYLVAFGVSVFHRWRAGRTREKLDRSAEGLPVFILLRTGGIFSMLGALAYILHPSWLAWASLPLPSAARWAGAVLAGVGLALATWTLRHLGRNITDTVVPRKNAGLVTSGPYRRLRHPLYTFGTLLGVALGLVAANGFFWALLFLLWPVLAYRTRMEEAMLVERFGDSYREYMRRTGKFLPKIR